MDFLAANYEWLKDQVLDHAEEFIIFDLPGQLELFLNSDSLRSVLSRLGENLGVDANGDERRLKVGMVELFDSHYIQDPYKYLSACTYSLVSMINLELPHINVLSKADLIGNSTSLDFSLDYYTSCADLTPLENKLTGATSNSFPHFSSRFSKLTKNLCSMLENYAMTSFIPLEISDKASVGNLVAMIDKCLGFVISNNSDPASDEIAGDARLVVDMTQNLLGQGLTNLEKRVEMDQEQRLQEELKIFELLASGTIDEDEADRRLATLG